MSAGAVRVLAPEPVRMPLPAARPRLRLVASHAELSSDERAVPDAHCRASAEPAIRFTRQGRLVITLMVTVAVAALALVLASSVDAAAPHIDHVTTVSAGQTLSEVAAAQLPSLPIRDAVARIQLVNALNTSQVQAGQVLLIPVMP